MENDAKLTELKRLIQEGIDDIEAGRSVEFNPESFRAHMEQVIAAARRRKAKRAS